MRLRSYGLGLVSALVCTLALVGCKPAGSASDANTTDDAFSDELVIEMPSDIETATDSASTDQAVDDDAVVPAVPEKTPSAAPAAESSQSTSVMLGTPDLTAGIPGAGPLTSDQIKTWLANPSNHVPLDIELPVGLAAGQALIQGIQENPLTRAKIELGRQLYFDTRLSADNTISCASCHHPDEGFGRHERFGIGVDGQMGGRNSPISYNRILSGPQFWDGRAESLEAQAVGPIANPIEMGNTHEKCVETLANIEGYKLQFDAIFPGEGVTIDNVGKAIASFERAIVTAPAPYDYYELVRSVNEQFDADEIEELADDDPELHARYTEAVEKSAAMSESARRGRELFFSEKSNCTACHVGANFADEKYHNLGVGMDQENPDLGRFAVTNDDKDKGAFKTPTLRNVALSAPYMHDGSQQTLEEVVEWYAKGGHPNDHLSDKIKKLELSDQDKQDLVAFMKEGLTSAFPAIEQGRLPE